MTSHFVDAVRLVTVREIQARVRSKALSSRPPSWCWPSSRPS